MNVIQGDRKIAYFNLQRGKNYWAFTEGIGR